MGYPRISRRRSAPDVIYICADGSVCVTPDGIGFYWYDSVEEAKDNHGELTVIRINGIWEDD